MHSFVSFRAPWCQVALSALVFAILLAANVTADLPRQPGDKEWRHKAAATAESAQTRVSAPPQKSRVERYDIDVAFEPEKHFLRATAGVTLTATAPTEAIEFELNPRLQISSVNDAQQRALEFVRSGRIGSPKLIVRLAEPLAAGQGITLTFRYEGALPPKPLDYITKDGILLRDESRWYPVVDLSAFTKTELVVKTPGDWFVATTGAQQATWEETDDEEFYIVVKFKTAGMSSSRAVAALELGSALSCTISVKQQEPAAPDLSCWEPENRMQPASAPVQVVKDIWASHKRIVGDNRLETLDLLQGFPKQPGTVGYSGPGFLVVSEDVVKWHDYPGYAPEFLPHEIAHQWFPIEVTLKSEEDGWLAESLAEYLAWRYLQEKNPEAARRMVATAMRDAMAYQPMRPIGLGLKLFALEDWAVTHATLYSRGMLVFRTLETVIDRERVDRALREYYAQHRGGPAGITDFRKICEEISGRDLGWFFDYYIAGTELPRIELRRVPGEAANEVAGEIVVRNVPAEFQVRVEMRLLTASGQVINHSVATKGEVTAFTVSSPEAVTQITLDPGSRILRGTEAALRHRRQRALLEKMAAHEADGDLAAALQFAQQALAADAENFAGNQQQIHFQIARLGLRSKQPIAAARQFQRALAMESLDPMATDFYRVWSHVFLARVAAQQGQATKAAAEARAGLAKKCPALETQVQWPGELKETSAEVELKKFVPAQKTGASPKPRP